MEQHLVTLDYRTPAGNPASWTTLVKAADPSAALEIASEQLRKRRHPSKIDAGHAYAPILKPPAR